MEPGGLLMRFGIAERLEAGRNLTLDVPEEGTGVIASTILSFGLSSETRTQTLDFDLVTGLRLQDLPNIDDSFDVGDTRLDFGYTRDAANSGLALDAEYLRFDIGFLRSLTYFEDEDGFIVLPADFSDLSGDGTRSDYGYSLSFDGGRQNRIGYNFRLSGSGLQYTDTTDDGLTDTDLIEVDAGLTFALTPVTTTRLNYGYSEFNEDDDEQTKRDTSVVTFGVLHDISETTRFDLEIGYADIDERQVISGDSRASGIIGTFGIFRDVANGSASAVIASDLNISGRLNSVLLGRSIPIPDGDFAATLGVADGPDGLVEPIGSLLFDRDFGPNRFRARLSREVIDDDDGEYFPATVVDVGYIWGLTPLSRFALRATYALTEETSSSPRVEFTNISAVYSHELTRDWRLNAGIDYRVRDDSDIGRASSPLIFASIGKEFFWRP